MSSEPHVVLADSNSERLGSFDSGPSPAAPGLAAAARFAREYWRRIAGISGVILVPCFWHQTIVATDLGSHVYNAWLAHLIQHGQAPGLWIAPQWTNILFDVLLNGLVGIFSFEGAEKLCVSLCVLIFFWGVFVLTGAASGRAPWLLTPCIALISYGYTFHMGFFNYYLALGISFWALAIFWKGRGWERLIAVPLAALVLVAHPFGLIWLVSAAAYIALAEAMPRRLWSLPLLAAAACVFWIHHYLVIHSIVEAEPDPLYIFNGGDQLLLFGDRYRIPAVALGIFVVIALAVDLIRRRREPGIWRAYSLALQLYVVAELAIFLFPRGVRFPGHVAIALITERLTTISAVVACLSLGAMRPARWHLAALTAVACIFFVFLYHDTGVVNRMEAQAETLVRTLPPNQRVMATITAPSNWRILTQHIIDRACAGYCFSYGNYEPGSAVFRVRALPGNPYVLDDYELAVDMEEGDYTVQPEDLPLFQVYQCGASGTKLCMAALHAGEDNDKLGVHSNDE